MRTALSRTSGEVRSLIFHRPVSQVVELPQHPGGLLRYLYGRSTIMRGLTYNQTSSIATDNQLPDERLHPDINVLRQDFLANLAPDSQRDNALRGDYARRQALVNINVFFARASGLTLKKLPTVYRVQFPAMHQCVEDINNDIRTTILYYATPVTRWPAEHVYSLPIDCDTERQPIAAVIQDDGFAPVFCSLIAVLRKTPPWLLGDHALRPLCVLWRSGLA